MVRNSGKGGSGHKKMKNSTPHNDNRELYFKDQYQDYGIIKEMCGNGRCKVLCYTDDVERLCIIRGSMRGKRQHFMRKNDCILISFRDYQIDKADVIHLYTDEEVRRLTSYNEITNQFVGSLSSHFTHIENNEDIVVFEDI
jgi:initiation factor 1A